MLAHIVPAHALGRVLLQKPPKQIVELAGVRTFDRQWYLTIDYHSDEILQRVGAERWLANCELIEHATQRPEVAKEAMDTTVMK